MILENASSFRLQQSINRQPNDDKNTFRPSAVPTHCTVSGTLALVLRMSRIVGIAPLYFERQGADTWTIKVSKTMYIYSIVLISAIDILILSTVTLDFIVKREQSTRMRFSSKDNVWLFELVVKLLVPNFIIWRAPATMKSMIGILNRINKLNSVINNNPCTENRLKLLVVLVVAFCSAIFSFDYYLKVKHAFGNYRQVTIAGLYASLWLCHNLHIKVYICLQFSLIMLIIHSAIKTVNDHLESLDYTIRNEGVMNIKETGVIKSYIIPSDNTVPLECLNIVIDRMSSNTDIVSPKKNTAHKSINALALSYSDVCEVMQEMKKSFGNILVLLVLVLFTSLLIKFYYVLTAIFMKGNVSYTSIFMYSVSWIKHLVMLLVLIEPFHWTHHELNRTHQLVLQITCDTLTILGPLAAELKRFFWNICLNKMLYTSTWTRRIYISILAASITYFVMAMQFTAIDDGSDR